jgi:hypothetical protein
MAPDQERERRPARHTPGLVLGRIAARTMRQVRLLTERIAAALQRIRGRAGGRAEPMQQRQPTRQAFPQAPIRQAVPRKARPVHPALERSR